MSGSSATNTGEQVVFSTAAARIKGAGSNGANFFHLHSTFSILFARLEILFEMKIIKQYLSFF
jgi:hypothetical protein